MLVNSIHALSTRTNEKQPIYISLDDTQLTYELLSVRKDKPYVKKIAAIAFTISIQPVLPTIKKSYEAQMDGSSLPMPETAQQLLLVTNQRIIKAHYGYTDVAIKKRTNFDIQCYIVPVDISEISPTHMDDPYMELGVELIRADDAYPGALEQKKNF
jgi:hypothetical protein